MLSHFPQEEYEARWANVERLIVADGFETAVVFGRGVLSGSCRAFIAHRNNP